jgi:hypothetical protein
MRRAQLAAMDFRWVIAGVVIGVFSACGAVKVERDPDDTKNDDDNDNPPTVDAAIDASEPAGLKGLGQLCETEADCPANTPLCMGFAQTRKYCTPTCLSDATGTFSDGAFTQVMPTPSSHSNFCVAAFTGTQGVPTCGAVYRYTPRDSPLVEGKMYTISEACIIACEMDRTCPPTLSAKDVGTTCMCVPL